ncbi:hypothetical protein [Phyllobacterium salinisoli]|uniref:hypothetical protein n=1 Tax=Phyllobacterium salinisoli TaxID=1899321 RepID=UPI00267E2DAA
MSLCSRIAPHLPHLRRFAGAITGSPTSGDLYVAATIETLLTDVSLFPKNCSDRVGLYKLLIKHFDSVTVRASELQSELSWETHVTANLSSIAHRARQAFFLISLEGLSQAETMEILELSKNALYALWTRHLFVFPTRS